MSVIAVVAAGAALTTGGRGERPGHNSERVVHLYTTRQPFLLKPMLEAFQDKSGIEVRAVYAKVGLLERLRIEGARSRADVILTSDAGDMAAMAEAGLLRPVASAFLQSAIPARYRDGNVWFALTRRVRAIFVNSARVDADLPFSYETLASDAWRGRVCMRSGLHPYNVTLVAALIAERGAAFAENWLRRLKENLARKPQGNDRAQARAIHEGECDVTLINSYYLGKMSQSPDAAERAWARSLRLVFPRQNEAFAGTPQGAHISLSAMAMAGSARSVAQAQALMEFLASEEGQVLFASANHEYPVRHGVAPSPLVASWGTFREAALDIHAMYARRSEAARLVDKTAFDR